MILQARRLNFQRPLGKIETTAERTNLINNQSLKSERLKTWYT